jgi:hypothetical protein
MAERTAYDLGDVAVLNVTFSVAGVPTDPTTVSLTVAKPDGSLTVYSSGQVSHDGPGVFHVDVTADQAGDWVWRWVGTGAAADVETGYFSVLPDPTVQHGRDLCTLEDVVARVPGYEVGDDDETDAMLAQFIAIESRDFMEETHREITPIAAGSVTRVFDVDWIVCEERELLIGDAASTTAVVLKGQDGTILQTLDSSSWVELPRVRETWEPVTSIFFPPLVNDPAFFSWPTISWGPHVPDESPRLLCEVTATWGFPSIPQTVRRSVATLVLMRYLNDTAAIGTALSDAANRAELNLAGSLKAALDTRDRFRVPSIGSGSIRS